MAAVTHGEGAGQIFRVLKESLFLVGIAVLLAVWKCFYPVGWLMPDAAESLIEGTSPYA